MEFLFPEGATPIDGDELGGLIPSITLQRELNELERENIRDAYRWALKSRKLKQQLLTLDGVKLLHAKMFGDVWKWAGTFRTTEKNIGFVMAYQVSEEIYKLCRDIEFRIQEEKVDWTECAVWCHHRMVAIHPFPNGNGRHARMFADLLLIYNKQKPLSWGKSNLISNGDIRDSYLGALRKADAGDLMPLVKFACSDEEK